MDTEDSRKNPEAQYPGRDNRAKKKTKKIQRLCGIVDWTITGDSNDKRDGLFLITGDRGNRKTRTALRFAYTFKSINHRQFSLKPYHKGGNVVYTDVGDLSQRLLTTYNQLIVIDEGYFVAKNIDVLKRQVKELSDTLSAVRNRGHIVMICFIKFNRAAKTILEVMNYWIHKPNPDWGILYIRDREFIGGVLGPPEAEPCKCLKHPIP